MCTKISSPYINVSHIILVGLSANNTVVNGEWIIGHGGTSPGSFKSLDLHWRVKPGRAAEIPCLWGR